MNAERAEGEVFSRGPAGAIRAPYDAVLIVSFGGPESREDVLPFLENVLRGRNVPRERLLEVAEHYYHFDGVSPINAQNRALAAALEAELQRHGPALPVYLGNRNWPPLLADTLREMRSGGVRRALGFFTSAFSSYSGCRQYRENIAAAQDQVGAGAPAVDKLRAYFNHPGFIEPMIDRTVAAIDQIPAPRRADAQLVFTAHSIPLAMAANSKYEAQLRDACELVAQGVGRSKWRSVYQSRSGPPSQPWLEPDIGDYLREIASEPSPLADFGELSRVGEGRVRGLRSQDVVVVPIGFISDHMEVIYDLDIEAKQLAGSLGLNMVRAGTVGTHPRFVRMIRQLIAERTSGSAERPTLGKLGPVPDVCPVDCCPRG